MRTSDRVRLAIGTFLLGAGVLGLVLSVRPGQAQEPTVRWAIYDRDSAASFRAGGAPAGEGRGAYEIVSLLAVTVSEGQATYRYGGPELAPPAGPKPVTVDCRIAATAAGIAVSVGRVYPYAGCVFFFGGENGGQSPLRISLGKLSAPDSVGCGYAGCQGHVDLVAGGTDAAAVASLCSGALRPVEGGNAEPLAFDLPPGGSFACPVFLTVLQEAREGAVWTIVITAPQPGDEAVAPVVAPRPAIPVAPAVGSGGVRDGANRTVLLGGSLLLALLGGATFVMTLLPRRLNRRSKG